VCIFKIEGRGQAVALGHVENVVALEETDAAGFFAFGCGTLALVFGCEGVCVNNRR
jgi:hypothetical protein